MVPSVNVISPTSCTLMQPHVITLPPPCFTVVVLVPAKHAGPHLNPTSLQHKTARLNLTEEHEQKPNEFWEHILWSDETKIRLLGLYFLIKSKLFISLFYIRANTLLWKYCEVILPVGWIIWHLSDIAQGCTLYSVLLLYTVDTVLVPEETVDEVEVVSASFYSSTTHSLTDP